MDSKADKPETSGESTPTREHTSHLQLDPKHIEAEAGLTADWHRHTVRELEQRAAALSEGIGRILMQHGYPEPSAEAGAAIDRLVYEALGGK